MVSSGGSGQTELFGWGYPDFAPMEGQANVIEGVPRLIQLADTPANFIADDGSQKFGVEDLSSRAQALETEEKALEAKKQDIEQEQADVQHMYEAVVKARQENVARRAAVAQQQQADAIKEDALTHGLPWQQQMGTDISFINTAQYPGSMKGAWHHNARNAPENRQAPPIAAPDAAGSSQAKTAMQLAVQEKVQLDAAKQEIASLKKKVEAKASAIQNRKNAQLSKSLHALHAWKENNKASEDSHAVHSQRRTAVPVVKRGQQLRQSALQPQSQVRKASSAPRRAVLDNTPQPDSFQKALARFLHSGSPPIAVEAGKLHSVERHVSAAAHAPKHAVVGISGAVVKGHQKSLFDYNIDGSEEPGEHVWPYKEGATKGSPCSVPGACNHHPEDAPLFNVQDHEFWTKRLYNRFREPEEEPEPEVKLGDSQVGGSYDDYVPPEDAYVHNLLTSATYGVDHFGHLAPLSKANIKLMYGPSYHQVEHQLFSGHELHSPGRGGLSSTQAEDDEAAAEEDADGKFYHDSRPKVELGEDQIGEKEDQEVPIEMAMQPLPGPDPDRFDHWAHNDPKNLALLNGAYWKEMKKDGVMDRETPAGEAYLQLNGASHDRTLSDTWGQMPHYYGLETAGGFAEAREKTDGEDWKDHTFTGTDESIERKKGTHGSDTEWFKATVCLSRPGSVLVL